MSLQNRMLVMPLILVLFAGVLGYLGILDLTLLKNLGIAIWDAIRDTVSAFANFFKDTIGQFMR